MDAALDSDGDLALGFPRLTGRLAAVAQRVRLRVQGIAGTWRFDLNAGLPVAAWLAQKPPRLAEISAVIQREILASEGVLRIDDWTQVWDPNARSLTFAGTVIATDGPLALTYEPLASARGGTHAPALTLFPTAVPVRATR